MTKFKIPADDYAGLSTAEVEDLGRSILEMARKLGFRPFAAPRVPPELRQYIEVEYQGVVCTIADLPEDVSPDDAKLIPPVNVHRLSDEVLRQLMQWWYAYKVTRGEKLAELRLQKDLADEEYTSALRMAKRSMKGQKDPGTNKPYTKEALEEEVLGIKSLAKLKKEAFLKDCLYKYADELYSTYHGTVEALNRQRMSREHDEDSRWRGRNDQGEATSGTKEPESRTEFFGRRSRTVSSRRKLGTE